MCQEYTWYGPIRVAVTGTTVNPGITDMLVLLGRDRTISQIKGLIAEKPTAYLGSGR